MADGKWIIGTLGKLLLETVAGRADHCETCCESVGLCNCGDVGTNTSLPRLKVTISWSENAWQASTAYMEKTIIKYTSGGSDYLFIKQNTGTHTSGGSEPTWDTTIGNTTADGTVTWVRIPNAYQRKYFGCLWDNGDQKEICPTGGGYTHSGATTDTTGAYKVDLENWQWQGNANGFLQLWGRFQLNAPFALKHQWHSRRRLKLRSMITSYSLTTLEFYLQTWVRQGYRPSSTTYYGTNPASTTTITPSQINSTNLLTPVPTADVTPSVVQQGHAPLNRTTCNSGVKDEVFGTNTDTSGVVFKLERLTPAEAVYTGGTPSYWAATAP